ncbi:MAG: hypothetical protein QOK40_1079 [Miltoncostaeaceae bacterium]|nr:hypothetical protein [Miltoncostaeaceae bacterium]
MSRIPPSAGLARAVRGRREELGLNRAQLALRLGWEPGEARSGWSPRTLARVESGERGLRDAGEVVLMARGLELAEEDLRAAARGGGWTAVAVGSRGRRRGEDEPTTVEGDLTPLVALLLAQQEEQTALLRRLVAAVAEGAGPPAQTPDTPPAASSGEGSQAGPSRPSRRRRQSGGQGPRPQA